MCLWHTIVEFFWRKRMFPSRYRPRLVGLYHVGFARLCVWGPYPFVALAVGPLWRPDGPGNKVPAFQVYLGLKCPGGTARADGMYYYEYTVKELAAFRLHTSAITPNVNDQAGA